MKSVSVFIVLFISSFCLSSCEKRNWDNPYDPASKPSKYAPVNLNVEQIDREAIQLTWWSFYKPIECFIIERKDDISSWQVIAQTETDTESWIDTNFEFNREYSYRVYAKAGSNKSDYSNIATIFVPIFKPELVTLSLEIINSTTIKCNCQILSDGGSNITECGVTLYYYENQYPGWTVKSETVTTNYAITVTDLWPDTYYIRAYAVNSAGYGFGNALTFRLD
jgi:hypothetical protein